jgi:GT2 family glycosyltransferase
MNRGARAKGLSIIIVNFNGENYLKMAVNSLNNLLTDSNLDYEILILDNQSTDRSLETIDQLIEELNNITIKVLQSDENLGFARGNNLLSKEAKFDHLLLINNDTQSLTLENLVQIVENDKLHKYGIATCRVLNADLSVQKNVFDFPKFL